MLLKPISDFKRPRLHGLGESEVFTEIFLEPIEYCVLSLTCNPFQWVCRLEAVVLTTVSVELRVT